MKKLVLSVLALTTVSGIYAQKLSPNAEALLMGKNGNKATTLLSKGIKTDVETVKVFIDLYDENAIAQIEKLGGKVYLGFDNCITAEIPVSSLREVSELDDVRYVEMGAPVHLCMDVARNATKVDRIHRNANNEFPATYKGEGVVIGIIDTGLEYGHIAFKTQDGKDCRIKRVWNQNGYGKAPEKFGYGAEYTTRSELEAARVDSYSEYHGSHVAGIATGAEIESGYYGMAPDADIVFVSFGNNAVDIPNAVQYIFDYAESVNKPCVINMSLGSHVGPHNGTSTLDQYFASAVGPGRILVGAAGNEGDSQLHATKKFEEGDNSIQTLLGFSSSSNRNTMVDVWGTNESDITVSVVIADALKGKIIESSQAVSARNGETTLFKPNDENVDCYFYICPVANPSNGCPNIYVEAYITAISETRGIGIKVTGEAGQEVHLYNVSGNSFINGGLRGWASGTNAGTVGEIGGSSDDVISVGSYNTRYTFPLYAAPGGLYTIESLGPTVIPVGDVSYFSSMGPTADGRIKPDVLAPGALVVSAVSKYATSISSNLQQRVYRSTDTAGEMYYYDINMGTSMATPAVTGAVALWLQANPNLTPQQVRDIIKETSVTDSFTGTVPNNSAGYGKLDSYAGLKKALETTGIDNITSDDSADKPKVWVESGSKNICCVVPSATTVGIYSVSGVMVGRHELNASLNTIDGSSLPSGVYILRFETSGSSAKIVL